jgi:hypothetical protein
MSMRAELLISLTAAKALSIDHIAGGGRPEWTVREAAIACKGLEERFYHAILFTFAGDESVRSSLKWKLWEWALERREKEDWPVRVVTAAGPQKYMEKLVELWLCEVRQPWRFTQKPNKPNLRRVVMDVSEPTWRRNLSPVYEAIGTEFLNWRDIAVSHINRRVREPEGVVEVAA